MTLSFPNSPQVKPSVLRFVVAPPKPPPFFSTTGELTNSDARYAGRKGSYFDRHPIDLQAGMIYTIDMKAEFDSFLFLENGKRTILRKDDDSGTSLQARITYQPKVSERLYIITTSYAANTTGAYRLTVRKAAD